MISRVLYWNIIRTTFETSRICVLVASGRKPTIEAIIRAIASPEYIITSKGEISPSRLLEELMAAVMARIDPKNKTIVIVETETLDLTQS